MPPDQDYTFEYLYSTGIPIEATAKVTRIQRLIVSVTWLSTVRNLGATRAMTTKMRMRKR